MSKTKKVILAAAAATFLAAAVLMFFYLLPKLDALRAIPDLADENLLLIAGDSYIDESGGITNQGTFPFIIFLDTRDWSAEILNLHTLFPELHPNVVSVVEARPFMHNGRHKLAVATRGPENVNGTLLILQKTGRLSPRLEIEFQEELPYPFVRSIFVADVTGDGKKNIVVGTRHGGVVRYYTFTDGQWSGETIDKLGEEYPSVAIHDLLVADIDEDGLQEILLTAHIPVYRLADWDDKENLPLYKPQLLQYKFDQKKGTWNKSVVWEYTEMVPVGPVGLFNISYNPYVQEYYSHARYLYFVDIDGDGSKEIVASQQGGRGSRDLAVFRRNDGVWTQEVVEQELELDRQVISLGDIDSDGKTEIVAATHAHDFLLLYDYEQGKWERRHIATDVSAGRPERLVKDVGLRASGTQEEGSIQAAAILNSPGEKYKNILYVVSGRKTENTLFYLLSYDPLKDAWEKELVLELDIGIHAWYIPNHT